MALSYIKTLPLGGDGGGLYEKGNLEIHSSDYRKHSYCDSDNSRRDLVFRCIKESPVAAMVAGDFLSQ